MSTKKIGLIVNPVAGLGGRVGLKGSDGADIQAQALAMGAKPEAPHRAEQALAYLKPVAAAFTLLTCPGQMGAEPARAAGLEPVVVVQVASEQTTAEDTRRAAQELRRQGVDLLLFAGGDGTARDIYQAVGTDVLVLGIPAGVKIHSAVYAATPRHAGELAALFVQGKVSSARECEVMDLDEDAVRQGIVAPKLFGYLKIPFQPRLVQSLKSPNPASERATLEAIAYHVVDHMEDDCLYIIGPGTTTRAITDVLGLPKTLIGVDVVQNRKLVASDVGEKQLLELVEAAPCARIVATIIGGQGFIFGRGNQQISPAVLRKVGRDNLIIVSVPEKIYALEGRPLLVDTGDPEVDRMLSGYIRIVTGYNHTMMYRVNGE
ncbi:MAG: ATP-NAD kinase [Chloroflexi bacterium]|nr:MAG: ATP-NAD kinase [Chloroflexota bacterium]